MLPFTIKQLLAGVSMGLGLIMVLWSYMKFESNITDRRQSRVDNTIAIAVAGLALILFGIYLVN